MKYKLLKDRYATDGVLFKKGTIMSKEEIIQKWHGSPELEMYKDTYEKVEEFKKDVYLTRIGTDHKNDNIAVGETFQNDEQAKAWCELREHIYEFPVPDNEKFYVECGIKNIWTLTDYNYKNSMRMNYEVGYTINKDSNEQERKCRSELINNYLDSINHE